MFKKRDEVIAASKLSPIRSWSNIIPVETAGPDLLAGCKGIGNEGAK